MFRIFIVLLLPLIACTGASRFDAGGDDGGHLEGGLLLPDRRPISADSGFNPAADAGPIACSETCDCPQGFACLNGVCDTRGLGAVWCCDSPGCPEGEPCLGASDTPGRCPPRPDAGPDASVPPGVGSACSSSDECGDEALGLTCWDELSPPFLWGGYCTLEGCTPRCPEGSTCITFGGGEPPVVGCMQNCSVDEDCRSDAYCLVVPNAAARICFPDCRDDLVDCAPRDGETYCSRSTGRCELTPAHQAGAKVGDICQDSTDCGEGQICMGEVIWGFVGGVCTQVCGGLPEATPCDAEDTCQPFAGIQLCFRRCESGACPRRPGTVCSRRFVDWSEPACLP